MLKKNITLYSLENALPDNNLEELQQFGAIACIFLGDREKRLQNIKEEHCRRHLRLCAMAIIRKAGS